MGEKVSIWELTIERPHNDFLKSKEQLSLFREAVRKLIVDIGRAHGKHTPLSIFPAMPVGCAVDLGRVRMPKADSSWIIYDQNNKHNKFIRALEIGTDRQILVRLVLLLACRGAIFPRRDAVDERIVCEVRQGTGHIIKWVKDAGGWPEFPSAASPSKE